MKNLFIIILILITNTLLAQNISLKKDTILKGKTVYATFKKSKEKPMHYFVNSIDGKALLDIHYSHLDIKSRQLYVVTFLNDHQQAMITRQPGFPIPFIKEVAKYNLVKNGSTIDPTSETQFISAHPVPMGYADVDQLIEY